MFHQLSEMIDVPNRIHRRTQTASDSSGGLRVHLPPSNTLASTNASTSGSPRSRRSIRSYGAKLAFNRKVYNQQHLSSIGHLILMAIATFCGRHRHCTTDQTKDLGWCLEQVWLLRLLCQDRVFC
jgi:hypothetical protein